MNNQRVRKKIGFGLAALAWVASSLIARTAESEPPQLRDLAPFLDPIRARFSVPALAGAVIRSNHVVGLGAAGVRVWDTPVKVTTNDLWHIGSLTKSMTATVAARMVEQGKIAWTNTIAQMFPGVNVHPGFREVTLEQLLAHQGGVHGENELRAAGLWSKIWDNTGSTADQRLFWATNVLALGPVVPPGTKYLYSNSGYVVAGAMLEKASGKPWEELIRQELFLPLGMASAGFGVPDASGKTNQPWGHRRMLLTMPVTPGPHADNPPSLGPAGTVHCTIGDLADYVAFHLAGERGAPRLLTEDSFHKLHTAFGTVGDYGLGWSVVKRDWGGGKVLTHTGSNTMFYAVIWIAPLRDFAVVAVSNLGSEDGYKACDEFSSKMIQEYLK